MSGARGRRHTLGCNQSHTLDGEVLPTVANQYGSELANLHSWVVLE